MTTSLEVDQLDLRPSARALELRDLLVGFMQDHVFPAEVHVRSIAKNELRRTSLFELPTGSGVRA